MESKQNKTLIMGVIGSDSHAIGNKILAYALKENGYNVVNLGSFVTQKDFIDAAIETAASVILVSSLYGHAELDCQGFKDKLIEAGLEDVLIYIGGILAVGKSEWNKVQKRFKELGFDRVAPPQTSPSQVLKWLKEDLN
jgi:methylaspartate mutase sigma subunit